MYLDNCKSVKDFREKTEELLRLPSSTASETTDWPVAYSEALQGIRAFRDVYDQLEEEPLHKDNPRNGLEDCAQWFHTAEKVAEQLPSQMDPDFLTNFIDLLTDLKGIRDRWWRGFLIGWCRPSDEAWLTAMATIGTQPEYVKTVASLRKKQVDKADAPATAAGGKSNFVTLPQKIRADALLRYSVFKFVKAIERHCRELEPAYAQMIEQAEKQSARIAEQLDQLWQSPAGSLIATYDTLMRGKIKQLLERARFNSFDAVVDACQCMTSTSYFYFDPLREVIGIFEGFRERILAAASQDQAEAPKTTGSEQPETEAKPVRAVGDGPATKDGQAGTPEGKDADSDAKGIVDNGQPKYEQIRLFAEKYLEDHPDNQPTGINDFLRIIRARDEFNCSCSPDTFNDAIEKSDSLKAWKEETKRQRDNKRVASKTPKSLDAEIQGSNDRRSQGVVDDQAVDPGDEAHLNDLAAMPLDTLMAKLKRLHTAFNEHQGKDPDKEWQKLVTDPSFDQSDPKAVARWYVAIENMYGDSLDADKDRFTDPAKRKHARKPTV